jgi:hypothetical protein
MNQIAERKSIKAKGATKEKSANSHHNQIVIKIQKGGQSSLYTELLLHAQKPNVQDPKI